VDISIRHFTLVVLFGAACLGGSGIRAQTGAAPTHRGLMSLAGPSATTVRGSESLADQQWLDTDVAKPKSKPADKPKDKPAEKPRDKPADKPKDKPADKPKHCHQMPYVCGSHDESSNGFTISVPTWCHRTVCD
jgi:hypothetical protein